MPLSIERKIRRRITELGLRDGWIRKRGWDRDNWFTSVDSCLEFMSREKPGSEENPAKVAELLKFMVDGAPDFEKYLEEKVEPSLIGDDDDACNLAGAWAVYEAYTAAVEAADWTPA